MRRPVVGARDKFAICPRGVVLLALAGCVHYQPRPIAPEPALAAFEARTLDSPDLARFLQNQPEPIG